MKKVLKIIGIIILVPVVLVAAFLVIAALKPSVPTNYTKELQTGGEIEATYLAMGEHKVQMKKYSGSELTNNFYVYYPKKLTSSEETYPVVVVLNGTGVLPKKYPALFKHLASWGFVVIGNDDGSTGFGKSADEAIAFIQAQNGDTNSIFYGKLDLDNIGITGHSQGGAGVFTAVSIGEEKDAYKAAVALSPTHEELAHQFGWQYDLTAIRIPTLMLAGTRGDFETQAVIPVEAMSRMYEELQGPKAMARRIGAEHGQMLYSADGYVTAWFMWLLQDDEGAGRAFVGEKPELLHNEQYTNQQLDLNLGQ